jgi:hypothetical protein
VSTCNKCGGCVSYFTYRSLNATFNQAVEKHRRLHAIGAAKERPW